jgi:hypothetical protein
VVGIADDVATGALAAALQVRAHSVYRVPDEKLGQIVLVHAKLPQTGPSGVLFDLLPRACGFEAELVAAGRRLDVFDVSVPVARIGHLIALKVKVIAGLNRAKDRRDLRALLAQALDAALNRARLGPSGYPCAWVDQGLLDWEALMNVGARQQH